MNDNVSIFDNLDDQPTFEQIDLVPSTSQKIDVVELSFISGQETEWRSPFQGFDRLYAITYSSGISFACNLISMFKYSEIIFGSDEVMTYTMQEIMAYQAKTVERLRDTASKTKTDLVNRIDNGPLKLFVARQKLSHEKIYLLESEDGRKRVVMGSANRNAFVVDKKIGELRYNAGMSYEADRILKEVPEDLEAHKSREFVIMDLDKACDFFETDFKKGKGLFKFLN